MFTTPGLFLNPDLEALVGHEDIGERLPGHEVAFHIVHAALDLAFVLRCARSCRTDQETVVQRQAAVDLAQYRVID